jgi:hypothetical protein
MRPNRWILAATCLGASACAAILGIDDGIPRGDDGGPDAPADVTNPGDGSSDGAADAATFDGPFVPLQCGTGAACNAAVGEACCRTGATTFECIDASAICTGTLIQCDRPEMCPPDDAGPVVCCGDLVSTDAGAVASAVSCKPATLCPYTAHAYFCGDAGDCPADASCLQSTFTLPGYLLCK